MLDDSRASLIDDYDEYMDADNVGYIQVNYIIDQWGSKIAGGVLLDEFCIDRIYLFEPETGYLVDDEAAENMEKPVTDYDLPWDDSLGGMTIQGTYFYDQRWRWPGGLVPYYFDASITNDAESNTIRTEVSNAVGDLRQALRTLNSQDNFNISFEQVDDQWLLDNPSKTYLTIMQPDTEVGICQANLGYLPNYRRRMDLTGECEGGGRVVHEFLHVLGMPHEQLRRDRDNWIEVLPANMTEAGDTQVLGYVDSDTGEYVGDHRTSYAGDFDFDSLMLGSPCEYNIAPTLCKADGGTDPRTASMVSITPGEVIPLVKNQVISAGDLFTLELMYTETHTVEDPDSAAPTPTPPSNTPPGNTTNCGTYDFSCQSPGIWEEIYNQIRRALRRQGISIPPYAG